MKRHKQYPEWLSNSRNYCNVQQCIFDKSDPHVNIVRYLLDFAGRVA